MTNSPVQTKQQQKPLSATGALIALGIILGPFVPVTIWLWKWALGA